MASKGTKESLATKLGFKSSSSASKAEVELESVRKENAHLRRKIDELAKRHIKPPDSDKTKLLERILSLEMLRERNNQQLHVKEQELETLRQQLSARGGQKTDQVPPADVALVQDQLKDALEKNQQWLVYDQQRESYVQGIHARTLDLEQQLAQLKQQQTKQEPNCDASASSTENTADKLKEHYDQLLLGLQKDLENQKDQVTRTQQELRVQREQTAKAQAELQIQKEHVIRLQEETSALQRRYEEKNKELQDAKEQLQTERFSNRNVVGEERKACSEQADWLRVELDNMGVRLEEERKRSADLLLQVNMLQKSLLTQSEEQRRIAALEQQIQLSAKDFDKEKIDRQSMQHQLQKVLKELRKARDQIAKLESAKQPNSRFSEPSSYNNLEFERLTVGDPPSSKSPCKAISSLLDESFLECPKCWTPYPVSSHRELLAHMDYCLV